MTKCEFFNQDILMLMQSKALLKSRREERLVTNFPVYQRLTASCVASRRHLVACIDIYIYIYTLEATKLFDNNLITYSFDNRDPVNNKFHKNF